MKQHFPFSTLLFPFSILTLASCEHLDFPTDEDSLCTFRVMAPVSRATTMTDFRTLIVTDVIGGATNQRIIQHHTDADFGTPTLTLSRGTHTITFIATDATQTYYTSDLAYWDARHVGDTFVKSLTLDIKDNTTQQVILDRHCAYVQWNGEGSLTLSGIHNAISTISLSPSVATLNATDTELTDSPTRSATNPLSVMLSKGEGIYTLIPADGILTLDNGKHITVLANSQRILSSRDITDEQPSEPSDPSVPGETLVLTNDTAMFFMADTEIEGISLADHPSPFTEYASQLSPYRLPTRLEASALRTATAPLPQGTYSGSRILCYDIPLDQGKKQNSTDYGTGDYYTFIYGSGGSVTKAGAKTAYSIKPIRTTPLQPIGKQFTISADFTWE